MRNHHNRFPYVLGSQLNPTENERHLRFIFVFTAIIFSLFGIIGNALLLSLYGNKRTRTYRSRDAIYIRRMAYVDFIICVIIVPYAVFFEINLVTNDTMCKTMEFSRHFFTYLSHLLLYTYSWELPRRHLYADSKTFNTNTLIYSVLVSILGAAPTIFIYKAQKKEHQLTHIRYLQTQHQTNSTRGSHRLEEPIESCQLITNIVPATNTYDAKQSLTWVYVIIPILVYSMSLYWFLINFAAYLNTVEHSRKESLFLTKLEDIFLIHSQNTRLENPMICGPGESPVIERVSRAESPQTILLSMAELDPSNLQEDEEDDDDEDDDFGDVDGGNRRPTEPVAKRARLISSGPDGGKDSGQTMQPFDLELDVRNVGKKTRFQTKRITPETVSEIKAKIRSRRATGVFSDPLELVPKSPRTSSSIRGSDDVDVIQISTGSMKRRRKTPPKRSILKRKVGLGIYPRVGSYKKSLATLIISDLILIPVVMASYLVSGGDSMVLSMVHFKSALCFYVLSILNPYLRRVVWGKEACVCFPPASDTKTTTPQVVRPSVLQVSFVRERYREKQAVRKLRMQYERRRMTAQTEYGTEIY